MIKKYFCQNEKNKLVKSFKVLNILTSIAKIIEKVMAKNLFHYTKVIFNILDKLAIIEKMGY